MGACHATLTGLPSACGRGWTPAPREEPPPAPAATPPRPPQGAWPPPPGARSAGRIVTGRQDVKQIDAKPRRYHGVQFRSILEADWAHTLDHYGMQWEYEPETVTLPSGTWYTPDFWLSALGTVIEVKGIGIPRIGKTIELAKEVNAEAIVIIGFQPVRRTLSPYSWGSFLQWRDAAGYDTRLARCQHCRAWQWIRPQISRACRLCPARHEGLLAKPGEMRFLPAGPDTSWIDNL